MITVYFWQYRFSIANYHTHRKLLFLSPVQFTLLSVLRCFQSMPAAHIYIYIQAPHLQGSRSIGKTLTLFCATYFSIIPQSKGHNSHSKHWAGFPCANCSRSLFFGALSKLLVLMTRSVHHCLSTCFWRTRRLLSKVYWSKDTHTKLFNQSLTVQSTQNFHSAEKDDTPLHWHIFLWWMQNLSPYHFSLRTSAYHRPF